MPHKHNSNISLFSYLLVVYVTHSVLSFAFFLLAIGPLFCGDGCEAILEMTLFQNLFSFAMSLLISLIVIASTAKKSKMSLGEENFWRAVYCSAGCLVASEVYGFLFGYGGILHTVLTLNPKGWTDLDTI